jgi:hypothetical protein
MIVDERLDGVWRLTGVAAGGGDALAFADPEFKIVAWNGRFVGVSHGGVALLGSLLWAGPEHVDFEALSTTVFAGMDTWIRTPDGQATKIQQVYRGQLAATRAGSNLVLKGNVEHGAIVFSLVLTRAAELP